MKTTLFNRPWRASQPASSGLWASGTALTAALLLLATANLSAGIKNGVVVGSLCGGGYFPYYGYVEGDPFVPSDAQFHTPIGLALDSTGEYLFVADRDNNAIRVVDLSSSSDHNKFTYTFAPTNFTPSPVGVALDANDNVFVLNRGNGNNGTVAELDPDGGFLGTNSVALTNANAITLDDAGNIYVTASNTVIRIPSGSITNAATVVATVTNVGACLQGLVVMDSGMIAACDSGTNGNGIYLINPTNGAISVLTGFNGAGDNANIWETTPNHPVSKASAMFNQPYGLAKAGNGMLIVADYGNNRVKVVNSVGTVTNLYGVNSNVWYTGAGAWPGWRDGSVVVPDALGDVEARLPNGVLFAPGGTVYVTEDYYHLIRAVTGTTLPAPSRPPAAPTSLTAVTNFTGSWQVTLTWSAVAGTNITYDLERSSSSGTVYYTTPSTTYTDTNVPPGTYGYAVSTVAAGNQGPYSAPPVTVTLPLPITANPYINGDNAARFTVSDSTTNAVIWYTIDGTNPSAYSTNLVVDNPMSLQFPAGASNLTFKVIAASTDYQPSAIVTKVFYATNYVANNISFGFASGEASSAFVGSPGQIFYAPVTLSVLPDTRIYSLQFNITATSVGGVHAITNKAFDFKSMLMKPVVPIPTNYPPGFALYTNIPPCMFVNGSFTNLEFINTNLNLLGVGWLERYSQTNLYDTLSQDLITYSMAHDDLFPNPQQPNGVIVGAYGFQIPGNATNGEQYQIQIGRPSATSDGIGAPGSDVYIATPTNGSLKNVTVGQIKYLVGDCAPFRWFNAGDFGTGTNLDNSDVMQVFQSAIYDLNNPPLGSDFRDSMDSCGYTYTTNSGNGHLETNVLVSGPSALNALFDGNDTTINQIAFGDGKLDVCDVYVTYRRSLDPTSLTWFSRFRNNAGDLVAEVFTNNPQSHLQPTDAPLQPKLSDSFRTNPPSINFAAADFTASASQTLQIPITAKIFGDYPLRVLMLNLSVEPLDGSPALTSAIQFKPNAALGDAAMTSSTGNGNCAGTWLNSTIAGLTGTATLGTLTVTIPANAPSSAAYAIHFDHASASPNGIASFPKRTLTGLILLSDRSSSSYNDGIPDSWRLRYFGTVYNLLSQAAADADGDGASNWHEYIAGTDPTDPKSLLRVATDQAVAQQSQDCVVRWPSVAGKHYVIERSASLFGPVWTPVSTITGSGNDMDFHDTTGGSVRFYRVHVTP